MKTLYGFALFSFGLVSFLSAEVENNAEALALFNSDQSERKKVVGNPALYRELMKNDNKRLAAAKTLYRSNSLTTGADYYHVAIIFHHSRHPDNSLLAHILCTVALAKGEMRARKLSAQSLDQYLQAIWRDQLFGSQPGRPMLHDPYRVSGLITDQVRREMGLASLDKLKGKLDRK